ncbi:MAG: AAA family ATPase [Nanoarchaeota archaeon]|nr:AAA family ATPase [Nanoarchaeota archaeon]
MVYKIGLLGTHGTGKTTLAHGVAAEIKKNDYTVRVISEIATIARERGFPIDRETTLAAQGWILLNQCAAELEAEIHGYKIAICDRTVFDNDKYLRRAVGNEHHYGQLAKGHAQTHPYQALYYLPLTFDLRPEKRDSSPEFQREMDTLISEYVTFNLPQCIKLPNDKPDQWVNIVLQKTLKDLRGD